MVHIQNMLSTDDNKTFAKLDKTLLAMKDKFLKLEEKEKKDREKLESKIETESNNLLKIVIFVTLALSGKKLEEKEDKQRKRDEEIRAREEEKQRKKEDIRAKEEEKQRKKEEELAKMKEKKEPKKVEKPDDKEKKVKQVCSVLEDFVHC